MTQLNVPIGAVITDSDRYGSATPATDGSATTETVAVYRRLLTDFGSGTVALGANDRSRSDGTLFYGTVAALEAACGKYPVMLAWEWADPDSQTVEYALMVSSLKAHYARGGICGMHFHFGSFLAGGSSSDKDREKASYDEVTQIKSTGTRVTQYRATLDKIANCLNNDMVSGGVKIPVILRIFHELNGWSDEPDQTISTMTTTGGFATANFSAAHGLVPGDFIQVNSCTPTAYNGLRYISTTPTTTQVTFEQSGSPAALSGTGIAFKVVGMWWAGNDRAADLKIVWQETVAYLRDTKGVHNALYCWCPYTYDGILYASTNPATYPYATWYPGDSYVDIVATDYYGENKGASNWGIDKAAFRDSTNTLIRNYCQAKRKPFVVSELGYRVGGSIANLWDELTFTPLLRDFPQCRAVSFWGPEFMGVSGTVAYAGFQAALADERVIGL